MNNRTGASPLDHHMPGPGMWSPALRLALLLITTLALVAPLTVQTAFAAGPGAPATAPQQAGDDETDDGNGAQDGEDGQDAEDGNGAQDGTDGEDTADGEDGENGEQADGAAGGEENGNDRFYVLLGIFAFVGLTLVGIMFAVFGYVGSGR